MHIITNLNGKTSQTVEKKVPKGGDREADRARDGMREEAVWDLLQAPGKLVVVEDDESVSGGMESDGGKRGKRGKKGTWVG